MLIIRKEQMEAFARQAREQFIHDSIAHIRTVLPDEYAFLGDSRVRESVDLALQRADGYGITDTYDVLRYLNLMYSLGFDFDRDEQYDWAAGILTDKSLSSRTRMDLLVERASVSSGVPNER